MARRLLIPLLISIVQTVSAQQDLLTVPRGIVLPWDSTARVRLLASLNGFLSEKEQPNDRNSYVSKEHFLGTSAELDEMKGMERSANPKDDHLYKAYLTNVIELRDRRFLMQFSYLGTKEGSPVLRASFTVIAEPDSDRFSFSSPLERNTRGWKTASFGQTTLHYMNTLDTAVAHAYCRLSDAYDAKLNAPAKPVDYYCCGTLQEALRSIGVDYKADLNGRAYGSSSADGQDTDMVLDGVLPTDLRSFDPHDLWHARLHRVVPLSTINRAVDEGTAYLYGGGYGLSWEEVLAKFKAYAAANPDADWLALYNEDLNFDKTDPFPLNVDHIINSLIIERIEKEKGFQAVLELLTCGRHENGNANYFTALDRIAGINTSNFNEKVWEMLRTS